MTIPVSKRPKEVRLVRSLMTLRNITPEMLAGHTGLQLENLQAWLNGTPSALSNRSYVSMLTYLGLTRHGLSGSYVQVWNLDVNSKFSSEQLQAFEEISNWLSGGQLMEIKGSYQKWLNKTRVFAVRGKHFKVLLNLHSGIRKPPSLNVDHFLNMVSIRMRDNSPAPISEVDALYWHAARNAQLTPSEFDDIFLETYDKWSWNDLRLIARERGITPSDLAESILAKDSKQSQNFTEPVEEKVSDKPSEKNSKQEVPIERSAHVMFSPSVRS